MPWTKQQQKVIDQRDADILVSAAAGSDIYESSSRGDERKDYGGT